MKKDRKSPRVDIHQHVTDRIIAAIEKGAGSFEMPWHRSGLDLSRPSNVDTGRAYRGVNVVALWVAAQSRGYATGVWGTYRQWQKANAQVRKGEKATLVVFYKDFEVEEQDPATGATTTETRLFARASAVFNGDQVDGWEPPVIERPNAVEAVAQADAFVQGTGADIRHGGDRAFYRPSSDHIQMPPMEAFRDTSSSTATEGYCMSSLTGPAATSAAIGSSVSGSATKPTPWKSSWPSWARRSCAPIWASRSSPGRTMLPISPVGSRR